MTSDFSKLLEGVVWIWEKHFTWFFSLLNRDSDEITLLICLFVTDFSYHKFHELSCSEFNNFFLS